MKIFRWTDKKDRIMQQTHRKVEEVMDGGPESRIWDVVEETIQAVDMLTEKA